MDNYKFKLSIFIALIIILIGAIYYGIFGFSVSYLSEKEIKEGGKPNDDLINSLKINDIDTVYDKENNIFYYSIPSEYKNKKYTLKLNVDDGYKYKFLNYNTNVIDVNYENLIDVIIYNDKYYFETKIQLTNLPLIEIITDTIITDNDTNSVFKYINPSNLDKVVSHNSKIHIRGATSKRYYKKSYKIEFYNKDYEKEKSVNISNFYYGSDFILDATYRDNSKIRNVIATEIWNSISDDFTNIDIYSEFTEVFINGKHMGLYVFTEPINRKRLSLNKNTETNTSVILKSTEWEASKINNGYTNILDDTYSGYELKYPNDESLFSISWEKILSKLSEYYKKEKSITYKQLNKIFDVNNYIDMILFNSFINNSDNNMIKNNYFYMQSLNDKINIQPWDMEFSFGLKYSEKDENNFVKNENDYTDIMFDIKHNDKKINSLLINKYWNYRRSVLSDKYIDDLIDKYLSALNNGATKRDSELWINYDVEKEIEDVRTWLHERIKVYDNYIRGLENE